MNNPARDTPITMSARRVFALAAALRLDLSESLRARWFHLYTIVFGLVVALLLGFGLADSRVMGFTGLTRGLVVFVQVAMAILPIFILIATVRSIAADREAGIFEYMLSLPVPLGAWYWGRLLGRMTVAMAPLLLCLTILVSYGLVLGTTIPWLHLAIDLLLLLSISTCFVGIGFLISTLARGVDAAQAIAFLLWILLLVLLDLVLLGVMIKSQAPVELVVGIALLNPLQVFRIASMLLFDPQLVLLGPAAWVILDHFGRPGFIIYALLYPGLLGMLSALIGFAVFKRGDLP